MNSGISRRVALVVSFAFGVALAWAPAAGATTFCVPGFHAACPDNGTNVAQADLETAMQSNGSDGIADVVHVDAGTFTDSGSWEATGTDALTVIGAGPAATELTTSSAANAYVVNLGPRTVTVKDLTVAIPAIKTSGAPGLQLRNDTLENVDIVSRAVNARAIPSVQGSGSAYRGGTIYAESGGTLTDGFATNALLGAGHTFTIEDATVIGAQTAVSVSTTSSIPIGTVNIRRSRFNVSNLGISAAAGTVNVENTQVITGSSALAAFVGSGSSESATLNANHVSLRTTTMGSVAVGTTSVASGGTGNASLNVTNSVARGFSVKHVRSSLGTGEANVFFSYSNVPTSNGTSSGPGAATYGSGNIDADPLFANPASNLALLAGSPSIDAADPASLLGEDINGNPRPVDGDGDTVARSDQGAYEHPELADTAPPETTIESGPDEGSVVATSQVTFTFSSDEPGTFQCKLDGGAFAPCTSPHQLTGLADGEHTFSVKAIDDALNEDPTPATRTFTVDTTPPETQIVSGPVEGSTIATTATTFAFTASEPGSTFECRLDGGAFAPCTSPRQLTGLSQGQHSFEVRATDAVGNTHPTPTARSFAVDTVAPETTIVSGPANGATIPTAAVSFGFTSSEPGSTFECRLDEGAFGPCASPRQLNGLSEGTHSFRVRAIDGAGNTDPTPAVRTFTVDRTPPETRIVFGPGPKAKSKGRVRFTFRSSEPGSSFRCRFGKKPFRPCTSPLKRLIKKNGQHRFEVQAIDAAGNVDRTPARKKFRVRRTR